ncbi:DNA polymerase I [Anaerobacterium chartisolvens]|uniref:DNA polymerase I n=1 Tax=Anaerobacterium chartisolvens TaxID=1297424 RepID=A0A369B175_9FIRM|nr:DNA polymerase I [Anaerobacterium chartisolvens]RCX15422.1 DNA polymerase I [Anaerobacterium chartisolvens]
MNNEKLMIIDGNSIINRAFYGLQGKQLLSTSDGLYTNAVYGFINILYKYLEEENPEYLCVAFDLKAPTFRHKEFEGYKANRKGMPPELAMQMPVLKDVLDAMNIVRLEMEGYEADDIIGSVSVCAESVGMQVVIVTGDRDSFQLVTDATRVKMPTTRAGKTETDEYDKARILEKYGVSPSEFIDVKGLMGDPSDNIPGVPGIGEKTALDLIRSFGSIENIYENIEKVTKKGIREKLEKNRDMAALSKRLAAIDCAMPEICKVVDLRRRDFDRERLYDLFKRLEFKKLIEKFGLGEQQSEALPVVQKEIAVIDDLDGLKLLKNKIISSDHCAVVYLLDKEDGFKKSLAGAAFCWAENESAYVSLKSGYQLTDVKYIEESAFLDEFRDVLEDPGIKKYGHEMKDFILYLKRKGIQLKGLDFDTMIAAYVINPSKETYRISELAQQYLAVNIGSIEELSGKGKAFVSFFNMELGKISSAAGLYAEALFKLIKPVGEVLEQNGQRELYYDIELPLIEVLADMEYRGFKINPGYLKEFSAELEEKISALTKGIYDMASEEFNINSPKQLGVILFEKLGLPVIKKTKTGYSTDAEVLEQLSDRHEIISLILEYRQLVKLKSTYVEGLLNVINPETGKIHSSFNQTVTVTGRISSTEPNLQNIPVKLEMGRKIRKVFVPSDESFVLCDADYSQIELRVLAHITGDENMILAFENNEDIHATTASQVFGVAKEEVTSLMRGRAKAVNFGIVYGIGDFSLSKDLGITRKEARRYIDGYLEKYPGVRQYMHDIVQQGKEGGFVATLFGRRRYLPELKSSNFNMRSFGERIAMNTPIQGSAADIIKIAMVKVYNELKSRGLKSRLVLQVHDELIIEADRSEIEEVEGILKESMEGAASLKVPLSVEVKTGSTWYETK